MKELEQLTNEQLKDLFNLTDDEVSGVFSRQATTRLIRDALSNKTVEGTCAMLLVDIDDFKKIIDNFGYQSAESAVYFVAKSIKECFNNAVVGRIGEDDFLIFVDNTTIDEVTSKANKLLEKVQVILAVDRIQLSLTVSIGITIFNTEKDQTTSADKLYENANRALYKAKAFGKNTIVFESSDNNSEANGQIVSNQKPISLNIQDLLNRIEIGIAIFRADDVNEFIPVFCNEGYFKLSGLTFPDFKRQVVKSNNYYIHPDDIDKLRKKVVKAFSSKMKFQHVLRFKTINNDYKWLSMKGNIIQLPDGTYEIYTIFTDAESTMKEKQILEERYRSLIVDSLKQYHGSLSVFHLNVTKNITRILYRNISVIYDVVNHDTIDELILNASKNVSYKESQEEFINSLSRKALLQSFEQGILSIEKHIPITMIDNRIVWCKQFATLSRNPRTGDIECVTSLVDDDKDLRISGYMKRIVDADYEFVGCINLKTGFITILKDSERLIGIENKGEVVEYWSRLRLVISSLLEDDFIEECLLSLELDKIINELKDKDIYVCTFPAKSSVLGHDGAFQLTLGYADRNKQELIITRKETFSFLDKRQVITIPHDAAWLRNQEINLAVTSGSLRRNKILIADDVEINRELLKIIFYKEFEIIEACDGQEAIYQIDRHYDKLALILLDMKMPKKTGLDVLIHNKMRGYSEKIPVILVTGSTTDEINLRSLKFGVADIVSKPYDRDIIKRRALNLIELYAHKEDVEMQLEQWKKDAIKMHEIAEKNNEVLIDILSSVVEFRSFESGTHIKRVRNLTQIMLETWLSLY